MGSNRSEQQLDAAISTAELGAAPGGETPQAEPDHDILAAIARGDRRDALGLCARRHGAAVGRLCMALLGSQTEADDAVQETLLAAHAAFGDFRSDGSLRAWLFGIARRRCARVKERRGAVRAGPEGSDERTADVECRLPAARSAVRLTCHSLGYERLLRRLDGIRADLDDEEGDDRGEATAERR